MNGGTRSFLTSLYLADDVALIAHISRRRKEIMGDIKEAALARGLKVDSGKTKVLTNESEMHVISTPKHISINGE